MRLCRFVALFSRLLILTSIVLCAASCSSSDSGQFASIALDESQFSDEMLRSYLSRYYDMNQNGFLDDGEAEEIRELGFYNLYEEDSQEYQRAFDFPSLTSLDGLEVLPELSALRISIENLSSIELPAMERLLTLELDGNGYADGEYLQELDVSSCKMLQSITLNNTGVLVTDLSSNRALTDIAVYEQSPTDFSNEDCLSEQRVILPNNPTRIQRLVVAASGIHAIDDVNLSGCDELEGLAIFAPVSSIELPATKSLKYLSVTSPVLTSIDLSSVPSIEDLNLSGDKLTSVDLSNQDNLLYVDLSGASSITSIDLTKSAYVTRAVAVPGACDVTGVPASVPIFRDQELDSEDERALRLYPRIWHRGNGDDS